MGAGEGLSLMKDFSLECGLAAGLYQQDRFCSRVVCRGGLQAWNHSGGKATRFYRSRSMGGG